MQELEQVLEDFKKKKTELKVLEKLKS